MRLTKEKLIAAWKMRDQIFDKPENKYIIDRFNWIKELFIKIDQFNLEKNYSGSQCIYSLNGKEIQFVDGKYPSTEYFACKEDKVTASEAFTGLKNMCNRFLNDFQNNILEIGYLLGGFTCDNNIMKDEYRIISNTITNCCDIGSLNSIGQARHPSSHFADNNYFFNVIDTILLIKNNSFDTGESKLVLRWPTECYYKNLQDSEIEKTQINTLRYRFPYKFFYMWTHRDNVLHPLSLMAYREFVRQPELKYDKDQGMDQNYDDFISDSNGWQHYSNIIKNIIPQEEQGDNFWDEMSKLISVLMIQDQQMKDIKEMLTTGNKAIILYGPPGTGKTYHAKKLVSDLLEISSDEKLDAYKLESNESTVNKSKGAWTLVQFHPNYTYEDFIGGISPNLEGSTLSYTLKEGIFKKLCDTAAKNTEKKYIFIIDEINRADLSSIFGELMYALEYRGEGVSIPNFHESFVIPSNVYIIGTMNNIDKSLVTFDLALRRRFAFIKIMPNMAVIEKMLDGYYIDEKCLNLFIERCKRLNESITKNLGLGEDYQIGHAYFGKIKDFYQKRDDEKSVENNIEDKDIKINNISIFELEKLWDYHLQPLLEEYLGNRIEDKEIQMSLDKIKNDFITPLQ